MELFEHQKEAIIKYKERGLNSFALFFEQGLGKTITCLKMIEHQVEKNNIPLRCLILCPQLVINNWGREIEQFTQYGHLVYLLNQKTSQKRLQMLELAVKANQYIIALNYESLLIDRIYTKLKLCYFDFLICDESQKLKNYQSQRTRQATKLSNNIEHKFILTGTPILKNELDLWSQFLIFDKGYTFGNRKKFFVENYFTEISRFTSSGTFKEYKLIQGMEEVIHTKIKKSGAIEKKRDRLDLPPILFQKYEVELSPKLQKAYDALSKGLLSLSQNVHVTTFNILSEMAKLQQIASGWIKDNDGVIHNLSRERAELLKEILKDYIEKDYKKIIVWCVYRHDYEVLRKIFKELSLKHVEVHGELNSKEKQKSIDSFMEDEDVTIFMGNPKAGGIGINLTVANVAIYYNRTFNLEDYLQSQARIHRIGSEQHESIEQVDIITKDTIDQGIYFALRAKEKLADAVLDEKKIKLLTKGIHYNEPKTV